MTSNNFCHNLIFCLFEEIVRRKQDNLPTTLSCICYSYFQMLYNIGTLTNSTLFISGDRVQIPGWISDARSQISASKNKADILKNMLFYGHIGFIKELYTDFDISSLKICNFGISDLKMNATFIQQIMSWGGQHFSGKLDEISKSKYSSNNEWGMPADTTLQGTDSASDKWTNLVVPTGNYLTDEGLPTIDINADTTYHVQNFLGKDWGSVRGFGIPLSNRDGIPDLGNYNSFEAGCNEQVNEILDMYANLDDRKKTIAELFAGTSKTSVSTPGFWILIGIMMSQKYNQSIELDLLMFFVISSGLFDAGLAAWKIKAICEQPNPINVIRTLFNGIQISSWNPLRKNTINGSEWLPFQDLTVVSPPYPCGVSDHTAFSIVAVRLLEWWFDSSKLYDPFKLVNLPNPQLISPILNNQYKLFSCGEFCLDAGSSKIELGGHSPKNSIVLKYDLLDELCSDVCMARIYAGVEWFENQEFSHKLAEWVYDKVRSKIENAFKIKSPYKQQYT